MPKKPNAEEAVRLFLDSPTSKDSDREIFNYLLEYLSNFEDEGNSEKTDNSESNSGILFEDITFYELDDFLNFYLEDNFQNFKELRKKSLNVFRRFLKFATTKKWLTGEEKSEWEDILNEES